MRREKQELMYDRDAVTAGGIQTLHECILPEAKPPAGFCHPQPHITPETQYLDD